MCDLQRFYKDLQIAILNFRLDLCCFVFSVRAGLLLCGYFNVISSMICLIAVATGVLPPLLMNAQQSFMDGEYVKSTCAFAYSADICLAVLLLCGMYRKDIPLLTYYTYCGLAMLASTVLVYSMVIGILSVLHTCMLAVSLTYQIYIILLVRSMMVELKHEEDKLEYFYNNYPVYWKHDIEASGDYPIEKYGIYSPGSSRKNSEALPSIVDIPKPSTNDTVEDTPEQNTKEGKKVKESTKKEVKEIIKSKSRKEKETKKKEAKSTVDNKPSEDRKITDPKTSEPVDNIQPSTSKTIDTKQAMDEKPKTDTETTNKPKAMRYPYKFIAIKVPKEESIKEEKESEDKETATEKDIKPKEKIKEVEVKEETKQTETKEKSKDAHCNAKLEEIDVEDEAKGVAKETKKKKRSIFGRKKSKSDDANTKNIETKK